MPSLTTALLGAAVIAISAFTTQAAASEATGIWAMSNGKVTVKVTDCGNKICAAIVALKEPISKIDGKPKVDRENPDPDLRRRPLIGLSILIGMKRQGEGKWTGAIYNPDDGKTYSSTVKLDGDSLKVKGCVIGFLCKTNVFQRVN